MGQRADRVSGILTRSQKIVKVKGEIQGGVHYESG